MPATPPQIVPDSEHRGFVARLPATPRALALLARFDRPIGWWLLFCRARGASRSPAARSRGGT